MIKKFITKQKARSILKEVNKVKNLWIESSIVETIKYGKYKTELKIEASNSFTTEEDLSKLLRILMDLSVKYRLNFFGSYDKKLEIRMEIK